jgi:hypothetical protein
MWPSRSGPLRPTHAPFQVRMVMAMARLSYPCPSSRCVPSLRQGLFRHVPDLGANPDHYIVVATKPLGRFMPVNPVPRKQDLNDLELHEGKDALHIWWGL